MGNLKLKEFHITSNGEPIYHLVYKATNEIVTPLETLKGIHKGDPSTLTYGQLLKQCNII